MQKFLNVFDLPSVDVDRLCLEAFLVNHDQHGLLTFHVFHLNAIAQRGRFVVDEILDGRVPPELSLAYHELR